MEITEGLLVENIDAVVEKMNLPCRHRAGQSLGVDTIAKGVE
tara:strand:- start:2208 stop:2333 length:126 start_codon:yes stop_codon:yes gene_type:complete